MIFKETRFAFIILCLYVVTCKTVIGGKNYYIIDEKVNFHQAVLNCQAEGLELANVLTVDEEKDLTYLLKDVDKSGYQFGGFWLSGTNLAQMNTSNWHWLTGGLRVLYTDWLPGEPNNGEGDEYCIQYAEYWDHVGWNDVGCHVEMRYICQDKTCC